MFAGIYRDFTGDVKSIIILYDNMKVFERHHVALKINNRLH